MKTLKTILSFAILSILVSCSTSKEVNIAKELDYNIFLNNTINVSDFLAQKELDFWQNKLNNQPSQYPYLTKIASANTMLFSSKGNISYLIEAENKLLQINIKTNFSNSSSLRALARNYISQHRFKESLELLKKAENIAYRNMYQGTVVISGEGVKEYYKQKGYYEKDTYMIKEFLLIKFIYYIFRVIKSYL